MKVLMTADAVGGVWTYSLELARALAPHDVEIVLATMGPPPSEDQRAEAARHPNVSLETSDYSLEWMDDPWVDVERAGEWLLQIEAREQPDLVHLNGFAHGALPWRVPVGIVAHSCSCSWWRAVNGEPAPKSWDRYRAAVRAGLGAASIVIAPTQAMLDALEFEYGGLASSRVIHNSRLAQHFRPLPKEDFVLSVGRLWDEAKNIAALERVAPSLAWPVYVAGDGTMPGRSTARRAAPRNLGRLTSGELAAWMGIASIYALPARYEPFGLSALEAALAGCALVLGDIPSLRELWDGAACFANPNDDRALSETLQSLIASEELTRHVAQRCHARALTLDPPTMAARYLSAYDSMLSAATPLKEELKCAS